MTTMTAYTDELRAIHAALNNRHPSMAGRLLIIADAIDAHLANGAKVPPMLEHGPAIKSTAEACDVYVWGWNACRQAMLSQRGEV